MISVECGVELYSLSAFAIAGYFNYLARHVLCPFWQSSYSYLHNDPLHSQDAHIEPGQIPGRAY
jgi:hypothetical protein